MAKKEENNDILLFAIALCWLGFFLLKSLKSF